MDEELVQNVVMDEELIQNGVMDEKFVKNFCDGCPNESEGCDGSVHIQFWWMEHSATQYRKSLEEFIYEDELWLLIGIPSRDSFLMMQYLERHFVSSDQHVKELMPLRECLHVEMQCYTRQHFADGYWVHEHPGRHTSWTESTRMKFTKGSIKYFMKGPICRWNFQKMRSESSEYMRKTTGALINSWRIKIAFESYFEKNIQRKFGREKFEEDHRRIQRRRLQAQYQKRRLSVNKF